MSVPLARFARPFRTAHRWIAPLAVTPLLLTAVTGMAFQAASNRGEASTYLWLLDLHRGKFGAIDLGAIYPFINGIGLLVLLVTGIVLWWQIPNRRRL